MLNKTRDFLFQGSRHRFDAFVARERDGEFYVVIPRFIECEKPPTSVLRSLYGVTCGSAKEGGCFTSDVPRNGYFPSEASYFPVEELQESH